MKQPKFTEEELKKMKFDYEQLWQVTNFQRKIKGDSNDPYIKELMRQDKLMESILNKLSER